MNHFKNILMLVLILLMPSAFRFIATTLETVGTTLDEVKRQTIVQLSQDHFSPYYTSQIKEACQKLPTGVREATMMSVGKVIRDYIESPQFETDYNAYLNATYPITTDNADDTDWKQERAQKMEELTSSLANPQMLDIVGQTIEMDRQGKESMLKMFTDPNLKTVMVNNPAFTEEAIRKDVADDNTLKDLLAKNKTAFKQKYAEIMADRDIRDRQSQEKANAINNNKDAREQIAKRKDYRARLRIQLQEFLNASATVDFSATVKTNDSGYKVFTNPDYEAKDDQWKFFFRCGREPVTGARKFAQNWLTSLH